MPEFNAEFGNAVKAVAQGKKISYTAAREIIQDQIKQSQKELRLQLGNVEDSVVNEVLRTFES